MMKKTVLCIVLLMVGAMAVGQNKTELQAQINHLTSQLENAQLRDSLYRRQQDAAMEQLRGSLREHESTIQRQQTVIDEQKKLIEQQNTVLASYAEQVKSLTAYAEQLKVSAQQQADLLKSAQDNAAQATAALAAAAQSAAAQPAPAAAPAPESAAAAAAKVTYHCLEVTSSDKKYVVPQGKVWKVYMKSDIWKGEEWVDYSIIHWYTKNGAMGGVSVTNRCVGDPLLLLPGMSFRMTGDENRDSKTYKPLNGRKVYVYYTEEDLPEGNDK